MRECPCRDTKLDYAKQEIQLPGSKTQVSGGAQCMYCSSETSGFVVRSCTLAQSCYAACSGEGPDLCQGDPLQVPGRDWALQEA